MKLSADPLSILRDEHVLILRACDEAEAISHSIRRGQTTFADTLLRVSQFLRDFVAFKHRLKEQSLLFPIIERTFGADVTEMSARDHEEACWWTRSLEQIARASVAGCRQAELRWAETAQRFVDMVRQQIEGEERRLFPLAEAALTPAERRDLCVAFEETDREVAA